jgi:hypothetical protein
MYNFCLFLTPFSKKQIRKDIEQVKFTVQQYGLQAYTPEEKRKLERQRLIKLGAKAPKREWINYKSESTF